MVTPAARRTAPSWTCERFDVIVRRACAVLRMAESTYRYRVQRREPKGLRARLLEIAGERPRFGYRRLHVLLRREGWEVNHKRIERLYRDERLAFVAGAATGSRRWRDDPAPCRREQTSVG